MTSEPTSSTSSTARGVALAALLIALGNIASRVLGLGRESATAAFFGRDTPGVNAFTLAWTVPNTIYDLLINGAISAALVPVFSAYAEGDEQEFWRIVAATLNLTLLTLCVLVGLAAWQAPLIVQLLVRDPELRPLTTDLVRLLLPALFFMGVSGMTTAVLYARRTFLLPAFAGATFNAGIILGIVLFHEQLDIASLAVGVLLGAVGQVLLQAPGLRGLRYRLRLDLGHPAVRQILRLYAPVAMGIFFSVVGTVIDRWLASGIAAAPATMRYATTLIQFPLGLVAAAVSLAVLPTLSRQSAGADEAAFRQTLGMGLKVVLLLIVPATVGLAALAAPIVELLFQRREFTGQDTTAVAVALLFYLPGLPAAAIDQVLLFAFYARKNTLTPNLVQGAAIGFYLLTALPLLWLTQLGYLALVLGNSAQWIGHMLLLAWLLRGSVALRGLRLGEALGKALLAAALMALTISGVQLLAAELPALALIGLAGGSGALVYLGLSLALRVEALDFFSAAVLRRIGWGRRR